jgi:hypothetical protein
MEGSQMKTFGPVDQRSLDHLERCVAACDDEVGVLRADHYPGSSRPTGGAIACEGCDAPSGVGYVQGLRVARVALSGSSARFP